MEGPLRGDAAWRSAVKGRIVFPLPVADVDLMFDLALWFPGNNWGATSRPCGELSEVGAMCLALMRKGLPL